MKIFIILIFVLNSFLAYPQNKVIDSLQKILQAQKEDTNRVNTLFVLGQILFRNGDYNESKKIANESITLSRSIGFKKGEVIGFSSIGWIYSMQDSFPEALNSSLTALKIAKDSKLKPNIAAISIMIGTIYQQQYNYTEAREYFLEGLKAWQELRNKSGIANAYVNIGGLDRWQENFPVALKNYYAALKIYEETENKNGIATVAREIGYIHFDQGNYPEALKNHSAALRSFQETGNEFGVAICSKNIGDVYLKFGDYIEALKRSMIALNYFEKTKIKSWMASTYNSIGNIYEKQGTMAFQTEHKTTAKEKFRRALQYYLLGVKINEESDFNVDESYSNLGNIYIYLNRLPEAKKSLEKSLQIARATNNKQGIKDVYMNFSRMDSIQGDYKQAYEHYKKYIIYRDSLVNEESQKKLLQQSMQYDFDKKQDSTKALQDKKDALHLAEIKSQNLVRNFSLSGAVAVVSFGSFGFYRYRRRRKLQGQQEMLNERLRISRELHDDMGSTLGSISIYSEVARNRSNKNENADEAISKIGIASRELIEKMSDIVWSINPNNESFEQLQNRMQAFAAMILTPRNIEYDFLGDEEIKKLKLSAEQRKNIFLIFKEAVYNIVKYAECSKVEIKLSMQNNRLEMQIKDNGQGFDVDGKAAETNNGTLGGNGLKNMRARAEDMNASLNIRSGISEGTAIELRFKV